MDANEIQQTVNTLRAEALKQLQAGKLEQGLAALERALDLDPADVQSVLLAREVEKQLGSEYRDQREAKSIAALQKAWPTPGRSHQLLKTASYEDAPRLMEEIARLAMTPDSTQPKPPGPLVSVVIPVFNREGRLGDSLDSVVSQSYANIELILVDDGSSDGTLRELERFRDKHPELRIVVHPLDENRGQATARNRGAEEASGELLLFHDSDDLLAVDAVSRMVGTLTASPESGWAAPLTVQQGEVNRLFGFEHVDPAIAVSRSQFTICAMLRREMFETLGGFNEAMRHGLEDWEFWIRALSHGYRPVQLPEVGLIYNRQADSTTGRLHTENERRLRAKLDIVHSHPGLYREPREEELAAFEAIDHFAPEFIRPEGVAKVMTQPNPLFPQTSLNDSAVIPSMEASTDTLRVLFVCHDYPPHRIAGAQLYAHYLAKSLIGLEHEVEVFYARNLSSVEGGVAGDLRTGEYEGVPVHELLVDDSAPFAQNPQYAFENLLAEQRFKELLAERKYSLVHFHLLYRMSSRLPEIAKRLGVPTVATLHDYWLLCAMGHMVDTRGRECSGPESPEKCARCIAGFREVEPPFDLVRFFEQRQIATRSAFAHIDRVFSPSAFLADQHEKHGWGRPEVLPLGWLPLEGVTPKPAGEKLIFGFCGQVVFRKGVDVMLSAFARLEPGDWELRIHGKVQDEHYFEQLRPVIEGHPSISYHGPYHSDELAGIYSTLDISLMPSRRENYPLTLLESLSAGVPPIAADVGGVREILGGDDKAGWVFPNGDVEALTAILQRLIESPDTVHAMRANLPKPKSIDDNAREVEQHYRQLIGQPSEVQQADLATPRNSHLIPRVPPAARTSVL